MGHDSAFRCNRHSPTAAEGPLAEFQHWWCLAPLELRAAQQTHHPLSESRIRAPLAELFWALVLFQERLEQRIKNGLIWQRIAVFLIGAQLDAGGFLANRRSDQVPLRRQTQLLAHRLGSLGVDPVADMKHG
jgi:hypothetical protein